MEDCAVARDFEALPFLELVLMHYEDTEKIANLPLPIKIEGLLPGVTPLHFAFDTPESNVVIFHQDFEYSEGLVVLGSIVARGRSSSPKADDPCQYRHHRFATSFNASYLPQNGCRDEPRDYQKDTI